MSMTDLQPLDETPWRPRDLPAHTVETLSRDLAEAQKKLDAAKANRHKCDIDVRRATEANDVRNLAELNRAATEAGRLVSSLELEFDAAKRRLEMAKTQAETARARAAPPPVGEKLFEVQCPDGRRVRHRAGSRESLQARLEPNYTVLDEIVGAGENGEGGIYATSLGKWLGENGFGGTVITLPSNNRPAA